MAFFSKEKTVLVVFLEELHFFFLSESTIFAFDSENVK